MNIPPTAVNKIDVAIKIKVKNESISESLPAFKDVITIVLTGDIRFKSVVRVKFWGLSDTFDWKKSLKWLF